MKLTSVSLCSSNDVEIAELSFRDPTSQNPYIASEITGLDAEEIVPRFYGMSTDSLDRFYELSLPPREVVLTMQLNPYPMSFSGSDFSSLRDDIYRGLAASRTASLTLKFKNGDTEIARVSGLVTKLEAGMFTQAPAVILTMKCDDPTLRAPTPTTVEDPATSDTVLSIIDDDSTAPHGFSAVATIGSTSPEWHIQNYPDPIKWFFNVTMPISGWSVGDTIHFSSEYGKKSLYILHGGSTEISLVGRIWLDSVWPIVFPGENQFAHSDMLDWDELSFTKTYWGV